MIPVPMVWRKALVSRCSSTGAALNLYRENGTSNSRYQLLPVLLCIGRDGVCVIGGWPSKLLPGPSCFFFSFFAHRTASWSVHRLKHKSQVTHIRMRCTTSLAHLALFAIQANPVFRNLCRRIRRPFSVSFSCLTRSCRRGRAIFVCQHRRE